MDRLQVCGRKPFALIPGIECILASEAGALAGLDLAGHGFACGLKFYMKEIRLFSTFFSSLLFSPVPLSLIIMRIFFFLFLVFLVCMHKSEFIGECLNIQWRRPLQAMQRRVMRLRQRSNVANKVLLKDRSAFSFFFSAVCPRLLSKSALAHGLMSTWLFDGSAGPCHRDLLLLPLPQPRLGRDTKSRRRRAGNGQGAEQVPHMLCIIWAAHPLLCNRVTRSAQPALHSLTQKSPNTQCHSHTALSGSPITGNCPTSAMSWAASVGL